MNNQPVAAELDQLVRQGRAASARQDYARALDYFTSAISHEFPAHLIRDELTRVVQESREDGTNGLHGFRCAMSVG